MKGGSLLMAMGLVAMSSAQFINVQCNVNDDCMKYGDYSARCDDGVCRCTESVTNQTLFNQTTFAAPTYTRDTEANICFPTYVNNETYLLNDPLINLTVIVTYTEPANTCSNVSDPVAADQTALLLNRSISNAFFTYEFSWCQPRTQMIFSGRVFKSDFYLLRRLNRFMATRLVNDNSTNSSAPFSRIWQNLNPFSGGPLFSTEVIANHLPCQPFGYHPEFPFAIGANSTVLLQGEDGQPICQAVQCEGRTHQIDERRTAGGVQRICRHFAPGMDPGEIVGLVIGILIGLMCVATTLLWLMRSPQPEAAKDLPYVQLVVEEEEPKKVKKTKKVKKAANPPPVKEPKPEPPPAPREMTRQEPEPVPEPEPEPEPEPTPEPVPEPKKGLSPAEKAAGIVIFRALRRRSLNPAFRQEYLARLALFKQAEKERLDKIANGKAGSIGCALDKDSVEVLKKAFKPDGAAAKGGIQPGDKVVAVKTVGRGGKEEITPTPDTIQFLAAVGPSNEVFEGSTITVIVVRDAAKDQWNGKGLKMNKADPQAKATWIAALDDVAVSNHEVTILPETEGAKRTRVKKLNARKQELNIEKMNVELVNQFMSDPESCRSFTQGIFQKADSDQSGKLEQGEIKNVFVEMAEFTGCPPPSEAQNKILFYRMDEDGSGQVDFDEFYPHLRAYTLVQVQERLFEGDDEEEEE